MRGIQYYGSVDNADKLREVLREDGVHINVERLHTFIDGTVEVQFEVTLPDGCRGFLTPASKAAQQRQRIAGRYLAPYAWVKIR